jgi:hypothetical protein
MCKNRVKENRKPRQIAPTDGCSQSEYIGLHGLLRTIYQAERTATGTPAGTC